MHVENERRHWLPLALGCRPSNSPDTDTYRIDACLSVPRSFRARTTALASHRNKNQHRHHAHLRRPPPAAAPLLAISRRAATLLRLPAWCIPSICAKCFNTAPHALSYQCRCHHRRAPTTSSSEPTPSCMRFAEPKTREPCDVLRSLWTCCSSCSKRSDANRSRTCSSNGACIMLAF